MSADSMVLQQLQTAIRAAQLRQSVYANNVANVDTPGYKRQDVAFESILNEQMQTMQPAELGTPYIPIQPSLDSSATSILQPVIVQDNQTVVDNNGNNVDIDAEMSRIASNQIQYNGLIQDMTMRLDRLRSSIDGGS